MERLTPERVAAHIERRREAVKRWARANPAFVAQFENARRKWLAGEKARKLRTDWRSKEVGNFGPACEFVTTALA